MTEYLDTINYCVIIKNDYQNFYLSDANRDVVINNQKYVKSKIGIEKIILNDFGKNELEITGVFELGISYTFISDEVTIEVFMVKANTIIKKFGTYNCIEIKKDNLGFSLKLKSNNKSMDYIICDLYNEKCRAELGDSKCRKDINSMSKKYPVIRFDSNVIYLDKCYEKCGYYTYGYAKINSDKITFRSKIIYHTNEIINLDSAIPFYISNFSEIELYPGCDKKVTTCCNKFNNIINFCGEPLVQDSLERVKNFIDTIKYEE